MTDRNLNHLMAEAMGWETADPNGVATWFDAEGKFTGYLTRKPADTKHPLYDLPVWDPETRVEQAMMVVEQVAKQLQLNVFIECWRPHKSWSCILREDREVGRNFHQSAARLAEAICLAIEAALKEGKGVG